MRYFVLAEIGINHLGSITVAKEMIDAAGNAGADAVKLQYYVFEDIMDDLPLSNPNLRGHIAKSQLSLEQLAELRDYSYSVGVGFVCTAFKKARRIAELATLKPDAIKIRYADFSIPFVEVALKQEVPLILASCPAPPIENMSIYYSPRCRWLYCIPKYPPSPEDFDAARSTGFHGFSDHFPNYTAALLAASLTKRDDYIIEKHVMLDSALGEDPAHPLAIVPDRAVSITFKQLAELVQHLRLLEKLRPSSPYFPTRPRTR